MTSQIDTALADRDALSESERELYDNGYRAATRNMTIVLDNIIDNAKNSEDVFIEVAALALGNKIVLSGGSTQDAMNVVKLLRSL